MSFKVVLLKVMFDFYSSIQSSALASVDVLKALVCVGLQQHDSTLTSAVVKELNKIDDATRRMRSDLIYLLAYCQLLEVFSGLHLLTVL